MQTSARFTPGFKRGFTLIELLVVIAIIGLLSSIVLAALNSARIKAHDAERIQDLKQISTAVELYYDKYGHYPVIEADSRTSPWTTFSGMIAPEFMPSIPIDPANGGKEGSMCWTCGEYYYYSGNGSSFQISTYLANDIPAKSGANQYGFYYSINDNCTPSTTMGFWHCN
jgi:prepilin-type N-terminal cleavage/methylation domain-containing protein